MDLHEQEYVNLLLTMAVERFSERIVQRNGGTESALRRLRANPEGEGVWIIEFVQAFFRDLLLDNPAGSCLVLEALSNERLSFSPWDGEERSRIGDVLHHMAIRSFAAVLQSKTEEALEQALVFGGD
ncbi:hypothetical protein [Alicyclobacillus macrosporangiidus]|uniref:hypothetical protein n=1 Tax=Alicyclobacillus macrosporangiidus TaxID=392015 RepID=UPI00049671F6|nr:hypothetical protein [Alicyclobacillus macrosporangiidus]MCL6599585.1 hypothetical protein [Alicyclobacillus macrosporangiidus]